MSHECSASVSLPGPLMLFRKRQIEEEKPNLLQPPVFSCLTKDACHELPLDPNGTPLKRL